MKYPHLRAYVDKIVETTGRPPQYYEKPTRDLGHLKEVNLIYPTRLPLFVHIYIKGKTREYNVIEYVLTEEEKKKYDELISILLELAPKLKIPENDDEFAQVIVKLIDEYTINRPQTMPEKLQQRKVYVEPETVEKFKYFAIRNLVKNGLLEPLLSDEWIEDIHSFTVGNIYVVNKIFGMLKTNVTYKDERELVVYIKNMSERIGKPVSVSRPIVDGVLLDGSRINIVFADDVSIRGPSFTIRRFADKPPSCTQLIAWNTYSALEMAYMWLALENGMNVFVSGETASGKTTALNAMLAFILPTQKVLSAEDTPEVQPPQEVWQRLVSREVGPEESRVTMFDILKVALRSRPNYILVGEIRGKEAATAFGAMQTGHSVMSTFHASSVGKLIQRLTGDPINVPVRFVDNLNIAVILQAVYYRGKFLRRCTAIEEIQGYSKEIDGVITRRVFEWNPMDDSHTFLGRNNSFILEDKIAERQGLTDKRLIYNELDLRARILQKMVDLKIFDYKEVKEIIWGYYANGVDSLPFRI
ncbi:MAG: type II/IV secretion system ATPase subunit [Candidatus Micrarchaeota archaeon]|nr:type II/IV secretion system ATPase subunit [Candidatus Micrarchaeota archaeon]